MRANGNRLPVSLLEFLLKLHRGKWLKLTTIIMLLLKRLAFMFSGNTRPTLSLRRTWRLLGCFWRMMTRSKLKHSLTEHRCCRTKRKTKNYKFTTKFALFYSWTVVIVWHAWTCNCTQYRCVTLEFLIIGDGLLRQLSATTSCLSNLQLPRSDRSLFADVNLAKTQVGHLVVVHRLVRDAPSHIEHLSQGKHLWRHAHTQLTL